MSRTMTTPPHPLATSGSWNSALPSTLQPSAGPFSKALKTKVHAWRQKVNDRAAAGTHRFTLWW